MNFNLKDNINKNILNLNNIGITIFLISLNVISLFAFSEKSLSLLFAQLFFGFCGLLITSIKGNNQRNIFLIVYGISSIITVIIFLIYIDRYGTPYYVGGSDDLAYEINGEKAANELSFFDYSSIRGKIVKPWHNSVGYIYFISILYHIGNLLDGYHTMIPRFFNCMCLGFLAVLVYMAGIRINLSIKLSTYTALFVGLLPIMTYNSAHTFRDIPVSLLLFTVFYIWLPQSKTCKFSQNDFWRWIITLILIVIIFELRKFHALAIFIVAYIAYSKRDLKGTLQKVTHIIIILSIIVICIYFLQYYIYEQLGRLILKNISYTDMRLENSEGLSNYVFTTPPPLGYLLRILYGFILPLPVFKKEIELFYMKNGTLLHYIFLPYFILGIFKSIQNKSDIILTFTFGILFFGMVFFTYQVRHITQYIPYAALITAMGYKEYSAYKIKIWMSMVWVGLTLVICYFSLKL